MKVLVADDHIVTCNLLKKLLFSWGYQVVLAADGDEAWEFLNRPDPPQIAVLESTEENQYIIDQSSKKQLLTMNFFQGDIPEILSGLSMQ